MSKKKVQKKARTWKRGLSRYDDLQFRKPHHVAPDAWFYETHSGVAVYWDGRLICAIPWRKVLAAVRRRVTITEDKKGKP